jgi:hypothetical protein
MRAMVVDWRWYTNLSLPLDWEPPVESVALVPTVYSN